MKMVDVQHCLLNGGSHIQGDVTLLQFSYLIPPLLSGCIYVTVLLQYEGPLARTRQMDIEYIYVAHLLVNLALYDMSRNSVRQQYYQHVTDIS